MAAVSSALLTEKKQAFRFVHSASHPYLVVFERDQLTLKHEKY
jgi:hypothetical protein